MENILYYIDKVEFKNLKNGTQYFVIQGWAFSKESLNTEFHVLLDNQNINFDKVLIKRPDISKKYPKLKNDRFGFRLTVPCLSKPQTICVTYSDDKGNKVDLIDFSKEQIHKIESKLTIEYNIDQFSLDEETTFATVQGWALSLIDEELKFNIYENNKLIESTVRRTQRADLKNLHICSEDNILSGFIITFNGNEKNDYFLEIISKSDTVKKQLIKSRVSTRSLVKAYVDQFSFNRVKNAMLYLKNNGVHKFIKRVSKGPGAQTPEYQDWFLNHRITDMQLLEQSKRSFIYAPKISIIVATFNTKISYLQEMVDTVINQSYSNWELCIADGSSSDEVEKYIKEHYSSTGKIKFTKLEKNYGISGNMNKALELATGEYVGLYDHDDFLELDALYEVVSVLQDFKYDIVYTDEDKFDDDKKIFTDPNFKPDYSEDLFRSHNYITHFFCVSKKIIDDVGAMREEFDGSQDYDFMFRCIEKANGIYHVPKILYHWRMHPLSTAQNPESKLYCYEAGRRAIEEHYKRTGVNAKVEMMPVPMYGMYHTIYSTESNPLVSVLIPNMNHKDILKTCINSLYKINAYKNFEIIIIENNSTEKEIFEYYDELLKKYDNIKVVTWKDEFNYSSINNYGVQYASGDYLLFLNNDTEMIKPDSLSEMLGCCMRPEVGAVGAKLLYEDDTVQHAGVVIGFGGYAGHINLGIGKDDYGYMVRACINCNYSAVTAACMMVKKDVFEEVGGFDTSFRVACNDVDLCLKIREKGKLIVYNAFSLWHHYESKSRGYEDSQEKITRFDLEVKRFQEKWVDILNNGDPYYNKNLF